MNWPNIEKTVLKWIELKEKRSFLTNSVTPNELN